MLSMQALAPTTESDLGNAPWAISPGLCDGKRQTTYWRREWDSNPRYGFPHTRFPSVRLKPLGHLSEEASLEGARRLLQETPDGELCHFNNMLKLLYNFLPLHSGPHLS